MKKLLLLLLPLISYSQMQQTFSGETLYVNGSEYEIVGKSVDFMYDVLEVTVEDVINAPSDYDAVYNYDLYRENNFNINLNIFQQKIGRAIIKGGDSKYYLINLYGNNY